MGQELLPLRVVGGRIEAPGSKSFAQRAVLAAMLSGGICRLSGVSPCGDSMAAVDVARSCGCIAKWSGSLLEIDSRNFSGCTNDINIGESALLARMVAVLTSLYNSHTTIRGAGSVVNRDMSQLVDMLRQLGISVESENNRLPLKIGGILSAGDYTVDGSKSSQIISGLLMALPLCSGDSSVVVENLVSAPYVEMTLQLLASFGIKISYDESKYLICGNQRYLPTNYNVEGDWSSAAPFLAMGAIGGRIEVANLNPDSLQADRRIIDILNQVGATVEFKCNVCSVAPSESGELKAFSVDLTNAPDLFPVAAALALNCNGISTLIGSSRLRNKESDRVESICKMVESFGGKADCSREDVMVITPGVMSGNVVVNPYADHRIAMAAAVAAIGKCHSISVIDGECVNKSYSDFWRDLRSIAR